MFRFKGTHAHDMGLIIKDISRSILPPLNPKQLQIPSGLGSYDFGTEISPRTFSIMFSFIENTPQNVVTNMRVLAEWLYSENLEPLIFDEEPTLTYYVRLSGNTDLIEMVKVGQGVLEFIAPNPLAHGPEKNLYPGTPIPYNGTFPSGPIIRGTFTGTTSYLKSEHLETGKFVHVIGSFKAGDVIEIDCERKTTTLNGENALELLSLESDFIQLQKGENTFRNTSGATVDMRVIFKEYFL